jgi:hypothetical protein
MAFDAARVMEQLIPGDSTATACNGPNEWGVCPDRAAGRTPACVDATWLVRGSGQRTWRFRFPTQPDACPVLMLDPTSRLAELWVG